MTDYLWLGRHSGTCTSSDQMSDLLSQRIEAVVHQAFKTQKAPDDEVLVLLRRIVELLEKGK